MSKKDKKEIARLQKRVKVLSEVTHTLAVLYKTISREKIIAIGNLRRAQNQNKGDI